METREAQEASAILLSMTASPVDKQQIPVDDTTSPNIAAPVRPRVQNNEVPTALWRPRSLLPLQCAKTLTAGKLPLFFKFRFAISSFKLTDVQVSL